MDHSRQEVATQPIGAQWEERLISCLRAKDQQVEVHVEDAPQLVARSVANQLNRVPDRRIRNIRQTQGVWIALNLHPVDTRPERELPIRVDERDRRRASQSEATVDGVGILRRGEIGEQRDHVQHHQDDTASQGHAVFAEAPPDQLPLWCDGEPDVFDFLVQWWSWCDWLRDGGGGS